MLCHDHCHGVCLVAYGGIWALAAFLPSQYDLRIAERGSQQSRTCRSSRKLCHSIMNHACSGGVENIDGTAREDVMIVLAGVSRYYRSLQIQLRRSFYPKRITLEVSMVDIHCG